MNPTKISILIKKTSLIFDKLSNQLLLPFELTGSQFKILMVLYKSPAASIRQVDLETGFAMTNPTVTGLVQQLERKKLVRRAPHPKDKRSKVLVLTDQAMEIEDELLALADGLEHQMTERLTTGECDQLACLLIKMLGMN